MKTLIIGMGEVGTAHFNIVSRANECSGFDTKTGWRGEDVTGPFDIMHIATPWLGEKFLQMVEDYADKFHPRIISILTTVLPGTCSKLEVITGRPVVHSTTRGLHPNLELGLLTIKKHVGGSASEEVAAYFNGVGIDTFAHHRAETTEVAHLLMNIDYAVNLAFADEKARICRQFGVDYFESVMSYTSTYNAGFWKLDHASKRRPVLTPPNGHIGGHCLVQNAQMLAPALRAAGVSAPLVDMIETYNQK